MKSMYRRQLSMMIVLIGLSFSILGSAFMLLSYRYIIEEKRDAMQRNATDIADLATAYVSNIWGGDIRNDAFAGAIAVVAKASDSYVIVTDTDGSAELIHKAARQLGFSCPGRIALTGFGNVTMLPVATVDQDPERQGELAARYLIRFQEQGVPDEPVNEYVETELVAIEEIPINI